MSSSPGHPAARAHASIRRAICVREMWSKSKCRGVGCLRNTVVDDRACCRQSRSDSATPKRARLPMRAFSESLPMALLRAREAVMRPLSARPAQPRRHRATVAHPARPGALRAPRGHASSPKPPSCSHPVCRAFCRTWRRGSSSAADRSIRICAAAWSVSSRKGLRLIAAHAPDSERIYAQIARALRARAA